MPLQACTALRELWLGDNRLAATHDLAWWAPFSCAPHLLTPPPPPLFHPLCQAKCLALSARQRAELCSTCSFHRLRSLDLQSNRLTSVDHLAACTALEELSLSRNGLTSLQVEPS